MCASGTPNETSNQRLLIAGMVFLFCALLVKYHGAFFSWHLSRKNRLLIRRGSFPLAKKCFKLTTVVDRDVLK
jgi:hypothetical protein